MSEFYPYYERTGLLPPEITPGEIVLQTPHYQVVTDFKPGMEGDPKGNRFFLMAREDSNILISLLLDSAMAHNIYNFNFIPVVTNDRLSFVPAVRADYIPENIPTLLEGFVEIPKSVDLADHTIPSPDRLEACLDDYLLLDPENQPSRPEYTFKTGEPNNIPDPATRGLRLMYHLYSDEIPDRIIHSGSENRYFKVTKIWFVGVTHFLHKGLRSGEFSDPEVIPLIHEFIDFFRTEYSKRRLTKPEDIERTNELIKKIVE